MHIHLKTLYLAFLALGILILGACGLPIEKVPLSAPIIPTEDARPSPIGFNKIRFAVPTGTPTIANAPANFWEWFWASCDGPFGLTGQGGLRGRSFPSDAIREVFYNTMESLGYDVAGDPGRLFDEQEDLQRSIYSVGGRITDIKINQCPQSTWFGRVPQGASGEANITVEWTVFDLLHRKNVMKFTTKGYGRSMMPNFESISLLYEDAMSGAIHNLGANEDFFDLVFYGRVPAKLPSTYTDPFEEPDMLYDSRETVTIRSKPLSTSHAKNWLGNIVKSSVLVQTTGHGSGYFITDQGHIITNAHVVGNAKRVRIVTSGKKEKLIAEVLRMDRKRDVALLKLEKIPKDFKIQTLPVRTGKLNVGEEIYAIGSPRQTKLQDTVTKGIVSAHRFDKRQKQAFIQADVDIYGGNSGGPLVDEHGNLVGMAVKGFLVSAGTDPAFGGLNWFIPIGDALKKLDITLARK